MGILKKLKPGKYTNRHGKNYTVERLGGISIDNMSEFLRTPEVQEQLKGTDRIFKKQTIMALRTGSEPPHLVGVGTHTKKSLLQDWDDDWQAVLEEMNNYIDITYNSFFDIPEEHLPVTKFFTADEIVRQYGQT